MEFFLEPFRQFGGPFAYVIGGILFYLALTKAAYGVVDKFSCWDKLVGIPPRRLLALGILFGLIATLVGGAPYFGEGVPFPTAQYTGAVTPAWKVKFIRLAVSGGVIGACLSLAYMLATMSFKNKTLLDNQRLPIKRAPFIVFIVAIATIGALILSKMSEVGSATAEFLAIALAPFGDYFEFIQSFLKNPYQFSFGSGMCESLAIYHTYDLQKTASNAFNNQCDVGPIRFPYIIFSIAAFNFLWLLYIYHVARDPEDNEGARRVLRGRYFALLGGSACLCSVVLGATEFWKGALLTRPLFVNTVLGIALIATLTTMLCALSLVALRRDIQQGLLKLPVRDWGAADQPDDASAHT